MKKTKILFPCGDTDRLGGIEKYNRNFIDALKLAGAEVSEVTRYKGDFFAKLSFLFRFLLQYLFFRPDVIICGHLNLSPVCYYLKKFFKTPYTVSLYGIDIFNINTQVRYNAVNCADIVITISEFSRLEILKILPHIDSKIFMHISAVDPKDCYITEKRKDLIKKFNLEGKKLIVSLARLSTPEFKGQDRVLKALPDVLKAIPEAVYLIVGGGQDERVQDFLNQNPWLNNHVVFTGPPSHNEKNDYYNLSDVYILPSMYEGFGIVFIEAMACGIPTIASDGYGCREGLLNGELGYLVPPEDTKAIAKTLVEVLNKNEISDMKFRVNLREKSLAIYGIGAWNDRVKDLLRRLEKVKQ